MPKFSKRAKTMKLQTLLVILLLSVSSALAVDDVLPTRAFRVSWDFFTLDGDGYFNHLEQREDLGALNPAREFEQSEAIVRTEYGYRRNLTMVSALKYSARELTGASPTIKTDGLNAAYVGIRQGLNQPGQAIRLTAEYGVWIPVEADGTERLPIGNESLDWQFVTGYAQDFFPTRGGFEMDFGYRLRTENPEDELFFNAILKFQVFKLGNLKLNYHVLESQEDTGRDFTVLEYPDNRAEKSFKIEFSKELGKHWVVKLGYKKVIDGRNIFDTDGIHIGFEWWR